MKTTIHTTAAAFDSLASEWNALLRASAADTPFLTHEWQTAYWRVFPAETLKIVEVREAGGALLGVVALYGAMFDGRRALLQVGGIDPSDYLDFVIARGREAEVGAAMLDALAAHDDWDALELYNVPESSPTRAWLPAAAESRGWTCLDERQVVTPILTLPGSFDDLVSSLDKRDRHELRRKLRRADAMDGLRWYVVDGEYASELEPEVDAFLDLMMRSHPDKAEFMTPAMRRFFHEGVKAAHRGRWLQLAFLEREGRKTATYLSFDYGDRLMVYNSGYDPDTSGGFSPGIVLIARLIEQAIVHGKRVVDFMRGDEEYKYRLGAKDSWVHHLRIGRVATNDEGRPTADETGVIPTSGVRGNLDSIGERR
jgi:CelD/BcsL family acetyltransferase involved in cellulose biosynthesis